MKRRRVRKRRPPAEDELDQFVAGAMGAFGGPTDAEQRLLEREGLDTCQGAFAYAGGVALSKPGLGRRERLRLELKDDAGQTHVWFLKRYHPFPWARRLWRALTFRRFSDSAWDEARNVMAADMCGIATMRVILAVEECDILGVRQSCLIVTAVPGESLEKCGPAYLAEIERRPPLMQRFNAALAELVGSLHAGGLVHRDLYACHIFLERQGGKVRLHLIDLARVFGPRWRHFRWRVKDLTQLKYSMPADWVERHWDEFLRQYLDNSSPLLADVTPGACCAIRRDIEQWQAAIDRKVRWMRRRCT